MCEEKVKQLEERLGAIRKHLQKADFAFSYASFRRGKRWMDELHSLVHSSASKSNKQKAS